MAHGDECRIAVVDNRRLDELYVERLNTTSLVGNIYKGKVVNIEPSIQACFIDFGIGQNGFLHISDLQSTYFNDSNGQKEHIGMKRPRNQRPPIQDCIKRGQEIVIQVIKDGIGTKGPTLSSYLSIPGRFIVLMPGMNRTGISRKIEDEETRNKLRVLLKQLEIPKDIGMVLRTASIGSNKRNLQRDLNYLMRLWKTIQKKINNIAAPVTLYQESDLVTRTIRDVYNSTISKIICDSEETWKKVREFLGIAMPRSRNRATFYDGKVPLFTKYNLEKEIEMIHRRYVPLKIGGSIVIDSTEALVAIDVNSGTYRAHENAEATSFKVNMEAAIEISRQLRLRDLGGVIVIDFIDMNLDKHRRELERAVRDALSTDRASTKVLRLSQFGLMELTRQRMKPSLKRSMFIDCPHCKGSGLIKSPESMAIEIMRRIRYGSEKEHIQRIEVRVSVEVAQYLQNYKRAALAHLETNSQKEILIYASANFTNDETEVIVVDKRGAVVKIG
ncbi:MAG: Rne/Rng family ribonuclease [Phycisphaerae bacterium]|nr:Rne/Rng family ribonuclease [Phycisphaerae bacterium]